MSYDFDERTDAPKRYCSVSKLSQQELPKTDEPRCNYCCQRLVAGSNWTTDRSGPKTRLCATCDKKNKRAYNTRNGGSRAIAEKNEGLVRYVARGLRSNAKSRGKIAASVDELEGEIERFLQSGCAMCGCKLRLNNWNERRNTPGTLQIDCIDPQEGYIAGNIQGLCPNCNNLKGHHTLESAERLYKHLLAHEYKRKYGFQLHHPPVKPIPAEPPEVPTRG